MEELPELELAIHGADESSLVVELRFRRPDDDAEEAPVRERVCLDVEALAERAGDATRHGVCLSEQLFASAALRGRFLQCIAAAGGRLRLRVFIGETAAALHDVRWETLRHPETGAWLLCDENIHFSRLLGSTDWRPVRLRPRGDIKALVVVASPESLADYGLAPIDVAGEVARARAGLGPIRVEVLASERGSGRFVTLTAISAELREQYDILYIVCHGKLRRAPAPAEPVLVLEQEGGGVHFSLGRQFVERVRDMAIKPALIVFASCQSAGEGSTLATGGMLAALGPQLAQAGVPAVVAMQGDLCVRTASELMPTLFTELRRDGRIDRALAVARNHVRDAADAWMPALFTRLRSGRIWAARGAEFRPSRWVLVAGVGRPSIPSDTVRIASAVGTALARRGYGLIVGGWEGVDYVAAAAFAAVIKENRRPLSASLRQYVAIGREPHFRGGDVVYTRQGVMEWIGCLKEACAAVLIGGADEDDGNDGTYETWGYGLQEQKPMFPFGRLRGGSARAYSEMLADFEAQPLPSVEREQFVRVLGERFADDASAGRAVDELMEMIDRCE